MTTPVTVLMPIGLQGVGKTTFLKTKFPQTPMVTISRDEIRTELNGGDATYVPEKEPQIAAEAIRRFQEALQNAVHQGPSLIAVDATNINIFNRKEWLTALLQFAKQNPVLLKVFQFPMNIDLVMKRQAGRSRQVAREIVENYAKLYEPFTLKELPETIPSLPGESFDVAEDGHVSPHELRFGAILGRISLRKPTDSSRNDDYRLTVII
jgi:predicted kinase